MDEGSLMAAANVLLASLQKLESLFLRADSDTWMFLVVVNVPSSSHLSAMSLSINPEPTRISMKESNVLSLGLILT